MTSLSGCWTILEPANTGGSILGATTDADCDLISISPAGNWLAYTTTKNQHRAPAVSVLNLDTHEKFEIKADKAALDLLEQDSAFYPDPFTSFRWSTDGTAISLLTSRTNTYLIAVLPPRGDHTWRASEGTGGIPLTLPMLDEGEQKFSDASERQVLVESNPDAWITIRRSLSHKAVTILRLNREKLAHHRVIFSSHLNATNLTVSPDLGLLSYTLGSRDFIGFSNPSRLYVLSLERSTQPALIASPVYGPARWSPDGDFLVACTKNPQGEPALYRWEAESFNLH